MALKPLSKDEDLRAIPVDEPVLVELEPGGDEQIEAAPEPKKRQPAAKKEPEGDTDDGVKALQSQMEDMRRANERLARERDEARAETDRARKSAQDTEADLIANGLSASQSELKSARAALKAARENGDIDAEADAQERIGRAAADVREYERAQAAQNAEAEERKTHKPEPRSLTVEESIDAMQGLSSKEKAWLKEHPDAITDPTRNAELNVAYTRAMKAGHVRGTAAYFAYIENFMGYAEPEEGEAEPEPQQRRQTERTPPMAAPVSRDTRSLDTGRVQNNQIQLTPAERQIARSMNLTDVQYARGKQQLARAKQDDPEKYARMR